MQIIELVKLMKVLDAKDIQKFFENLPEAELASYIPFHEMYRHRLTAPTTPISPTSLFLPSPSVEKIFLFLDVPLIEMTQ